MCELIHETNPSGTVQENARVFRHPSGVDYVRTVRFGRGTIRFGTWHPGGSFVSDYNPAVLGHGGLANEWPCNVEVHVTQGIVTATWDHLDSRAAASADPGILAAMATAVRAAADVAQELRDERIF